MAEQFYEAKCWKIIAIRREYAELDQQPGSNEKYTRMIELMKLECQLWSEIEQRSLPAACHLVFENVKVPVIDQPDLYNLLEDDQPACPQGWESIDTSIE